MGSDTVGHAKKRFGQNFLVNRGAIERIVRALDVSDGDALFEIGPGRGALTAALLQRTGRLAAVELDRDLATLLRSRFDEKSLRLYQEDVLNLPLSSVLEDLDAGPQQRLVIAGNLPYNISKPIAMKFILERQAIDRAVLMFQTEVARRLTARHGTREYGPLTVLAGQAFTITRLFDLPGSSFRPAPKVSSSVTHWKRIEDGKFGPDEASRLQACLRASFAQRRKTLSNNIRAASGDAGRAEAVLAAAELDGGLRPEQVPPEGYVHLAKVWHLISNEPKQ
jgi:16S rRNA (adenine1518-N6/adenine1519-N6)-dimethyltransferase